MAAAAPPPPSSSSSSSYSSFCLIPSISLLSLLLILSSISSTAVPISAASLAIANQTLDWQFHSHTPDFAQQQQPEDEYEDGNFEEENAEGAPLQRRSLYWGAWPRRRYYISYGALSANRVPCPPRSGRSYYTHNCYRASGPVHPYTRGCSAITRCRR